MAAPGLGVELWVDGAWADITADVGDDGVTVTRGRSGEAARPDPATMTMRLRNNAGQYAPRNPRSTLYGKIGRNTPIRAFIEMGEPRLVQDATGEWSTTDKAQLDITGDLDVRVDIAPRSWRPATNQWFGVLKNGAYALLLLPNGALQLLWNTPTEKTATSTVAVPGARTGRKAVRATLDVNNTLGQHEVKFYIADTLAGPWVQFGATIVGAGTTSITASTGTLTTRTSYPAEVFGMQVRTGIGGTVVAELVPTGQTPGATTVADGFGNNWSATVATRARLTNRHYLSVAEVTEWPQRWGASGAPSAYSPIECHSVMRRLGQGASPVRSALRRGIERLAPLVGYWPLEEPEGARSHHAVKGRPGKQNGTPQPGKYAGFAASDPIVTLGSGKLVLPLRQPQPTGFVQWRFLLNLGTAPANGAILARLGLSASLGRIDLKFHSASGGYYAELWTSSGILALTSNTLTTNLVGKNVRVSIEVKQNGALADIRLVSLEAFAPTGLYIDTTTAGGITVGAPTYVEVNPAQADLSGVSVGHMTVENAITPIGDVAVQLGGYLGERADTRMLRIASENALSLAVIAPGSGCERMGPQRRGELLELLTECADADQGALYEAREDSALRYRSLASMWNQAPAVTLPFGDGALLEMEPVDDDLVTRNVVTVTRRDGGEATVTVTKGAMGTAPPPAGVGVYDESVELNLATDDATEQQAGWRAHLGTVDETRWPSIAVDLAHPDMVADPALTRQVLSVDIGDVIEVTDLPSWLPPFPVRQVVLGSTVTVSAPGRRSQPWSVKVEWNCAPASPYQVGTRWDTGGAALAAAAGESAVSLSVATTVGPLWTTRASDMPFDIIIGGELMKVTAVSGATSPQTFTVTRALNGVVKSQAAGASVALADPAYWGARPIGGAGFGTGDTGGGTTPPSAPLPNTVRIGTATFPLSGVNPGSSGGWGGDAAYAGYRGPNMLIAYTQPTVTVTATNQWGAEVPADADYLVNSVNDRQTTGSTSGTAVPSPSGIVLSGHGTARDWLIAQAQGGDLIELIYVAPGTGGGGTGGGGTGGGGTSAYPVKVISVYKMIYNASTPFNISSIPAGCNELRLAFAFDVAGVLTRAGDSPEGLTELLADLATFRAGGGKVILSVGGAGNPVDMSNATTFVNEFNAVRTGLGGHVDGMDYDMEASGFTVAQAVNIATGLKARYGSQFAITMVPNGGNVGIYLPAAVAMHQAGALDNYGQQFYDASVTLAAAKGRIQEAINAGIPASKISVGMMNPPGSVPNGYWDNATCVTYMTDIRDTFGVRKAYYWEASRTGMATWVNNMSSVL